MFNFFKKKGGNGKETGSSEDVRQQPNDSGHLEAKETKTVDPRVSRTENDITELPLARKDVVNLLIPTTQYNQKTGVGAFLQAMAGKRKKNKKNSRTESVRISPQKEMKLQRSNSEREPTRGDDVATLPPAKNTPANSEHSEAEFVKSLVLQKYSKPHVSLVYVSNDSLDEKPIDKTPDKGDRVAEKLHAEALLREIARTIDCTIDKINDNKHMGATDSKNDQKEPIYETIDDHRYFNNEVNANRRNDPIETYKTELKGELDKLLEHNKETKAETKDDATSIESPGLIKKSNLKPPKSDTEGCSDDDRSDCGKKKVTFQKHIVFDDGDEQTDQEVDSSFESLTSGEEDDYLEDSLPDNDELLGGIVVPQEGNRTLINVSDRTQENKDLKTNLSSKSENDGLKRISSDNSDSGFIDERNEEFSEVKTLDIDSESGSETDTEEEEEEEEEEEIEIIEEDYKETIAKVIERDDPKHVDNQKSLVSQESKFQSQVAALTELADSRCSETERTRELIAAYRKEIETKDQEIEQLKCELASAYKESELVRQRSRALEEELGAARSCSADLADQLKKRNDEALRHLRAELEDALTHRAELESRAQALQRDCERLEREKQQQEIRAQEALAAAEANTAKWRAAHEAARSQAAARAERMLADCEWKMRELEQRAREADKQKKELVETVQQLRAAPPPAPAQVAELQQLRGAVGEQQRAVQALSLQLQKVETREEALKLEVYRLKELLDKEVRTGKEKEERYMKTVERLEQQHSKSLETLRAEHAASAATTRATLERAHAERTRAALSQLRGEADQNARNADRRLREVTAKFENLKEVLATKEREFEEALKEAHSKADWDVMQLRHLLDRSDLAHAGTVEKLTEQFEQDRDRLNAEWSEKIRVLEEQTATQLDEARRTLETTRSKLVAERVDKINKLKEQHRQEMDEQFERFMTDKEACLERMKAECRQEGEEDRVKREKELLEEIAELKAQLNNSGTEYDTLALKAAACGRTLAVTEEELRNPPFGISGKALAIAAAALGLLTGSMRLALASFLLALALFFYLNIVRNKKKEALARERELREKRAEDATKIKQVERASKDQIEHLTRKCACLRKLFDDIRAKLSSRERSAEQDMKAKDRELHQLRAEVARLTKLLVEESSPKLGARTRADGCEVGKDDGFEPRRKGGTHRTPEPYRKRLTMPELPIKMAAQHDGRRASVDLPAVQVPVRIKQLEGKNKD